MNWIFYDQIVNQETDLIGTWNNFAEKAEKVKLLYSIKSCLNFHWSLLAQIM